MEEAKKVYTESTPRLIELHKNYKGRKNAVSDYRDVSYFDNVNTIFHTGYFWGSFSNNEYYEKMDFTRLSEQEFIKFMELDSESTSKSYGWNESPIKDNVNKPNHYTQGGIEPIDYILANDMNFLEGNVIKYVTRYKHKNGLEDLRKAEFYLKKLIEGLAEIK